MNRFGLWTPVMISLLLVALSTQFQSELTAQQTSTDSEEKPPIQIGSKTFTESVILGEILTQLVRSTETRAEHRDQLGGTQVLWKGLLNGDLDVYPEYTGTISEEILAGQNIRGEEAMRAALAEQGVTMSRPLGFNNTYAIGIKKSLAAQLGLKTISDLRDHPALKLGFSNEFMDRGDGWPKLKAFYQLPQQDVAGLDHDLAYRGLESGSIDAIDLYATDAEIEHYDLFVLVDDLQFFPAYNAVLLYRTDLQTRAPNVISALLRLENSISSTAMTEMNARSKLHAVPEKQVAADFVNEQFALNSQVRTITRTDRLLKSTREHLYLVLVSVIAAIFVAIPLGILAAKRRLAGQVILGVIGILQTVPSLAMFVFLIPLLGLGAKPAIFALFLYSLLPIVRNTYTGLHEIPLQMHESAQALGLPAGARLRLIELPISSRSILAGIKTAVVINVGTATLGGFIGAGGYGDPIFTGIRLDRISLILEGAIPAALMALVAQGLFELAERRLVPKGLRLKPQE